MAILCLIAWKDPTGHTELLAVLHIRQDHLEERVAGADGLERNGQCRLLNGPGHPAGRRIGSRRSQRPLVGDHHVVEGDGGQGPAVIERVHRGHVGLGERYDEGTDSCARLRHDGQLGDAFGSEDGELGAVQDPSALDAFCGHGDLVHRPPTRMIAERERPGDVTCGDLGQEVLALLLCPHLTHHRSELRHGRQQGPRGDGATEFFDHNSGLHDRKPDAAVFLGNGEGGPIQGDHRSPELLRRLAGFHDSADEVERALLLEKGSDRGAQLFLLSCELELHWPPSPAAPVAVQSICSDGEPARRRSGRVYPTPSQSQWAVLPSQRPVLWETVWGAPGGVVGPWRKPGLATTGDDDLEAVSGAVARLHSVTRL